MPVTRADELDARPADNAKELLALADELSAYIKRYSGDWSAASPTISWDELHAVVSALRLSARQQASVEWERLTSIIRPLIESVCSDGGSDAARLAKAISDALLAKYDIFQKVEG